MRKSSKLVKFLAIIGALAIIAGVVFAIYKFMKPDYLDEYDDDDYCDDDFEDEDFVIDLDEDEEAKEN